MVENLDDFKPAEEEQAFMIATVQGMMDLEEGREKTLDQVKKRLGINCP